MLELAPFPSSALQLKATPGQEEPPQGMLRVHKLHEGRVDGDDMSFVLSRRKGLVVKPYSLPPVEGDNEAQSAGLEAEGGGKVGKNDIEF